MGARNRVGIGLTNRLARARICKRLWSQGINPEESIPPAYEAWLESIPGLRKRLTNTGSEPVF
jgi:hypothetical protein